LDPGPGLGRPFQKAVLGQDLAQGRRWVGRHVVADKGRGVESRKEGRLPGGALGQTGHTQAGVEGPEQKTVVRRPLLPVEDQRSAQQFRQPGHGHAAQGIVRPCRRQANAIEKYKEDTQGNPL
jgi:hypothetical protein